MYLDYIYSQRPNPPRSTPISVPTELCVLLLVVVLKPLSTVGPAYVFLGVWPSSRGWSTYQGLYP